MSIMSEGTYSGVQMRSVRGRKGRVTKGVGGSIKALLLNNQQPRDSHQPEQPDDERGDLEL